MIQSSTQRKMRCWMVKAKVHGQSKKNSSYILHSGHLCERAITGLARTLLEEKFRYKVCAKEGKNSEKVLPSLISFNLFPATGTSPTSAVSVLYLMQPELNFDKEGESGWLLHPMSQKKTFRLSLQWISILCFLMKPFGPGSETNWIYVI